VHEWIDDIDDLETVIFDAMDALVMVIAVKQSNGNESVV
jgi:phage gp29-like protein